MSYPSISPGMIKPPLEPTRWLWSSPRLKQAVIQKRCSCCLPHNKNCNVANSNCLQSQKKQFFWPQFWSCPFIILNWSWHFSSNYLKWKIIPRCIVSQKVAWTWQLKISSISKKLEQALKKDLWKNVVFCESSDDYRRTAL